METKRAKPGFELTQTVLKAWVMNTEIIFALDWLHLKNFSMKTSSSVVLKTLILSQWGWGWGGCVLPASSVLPGENTGVGCHFLLQGIFSIQGSNLHFLHWQADSLPLSPIGSWGGLGGSKILHRWRYLQRISAFLQWKWTSLLVVRSPLALPSFTSVLPSSKFHTKPQRLTEVNVMGEQQFLKDGRFSHDLSTFSEMTNEASPGLANSWHDHSEKILSK